MPESGAAGFVYREGTVSKVHRIFRVTSITALIGAGAAMAIWGWIQWRYDRLVWTDVAAVSPRPVAVVFGAGIRADGGLSPMLRDRMDTAIDLYRAGAVRRLLVSGDNRFVYYNEPGRMYDYAGRRTYDTCYRASAIFGVTRAILVTQRFHLPRALFTCRSLGVDAMGFSADRRVYRSNSYYRFRDLFATLRAWWDVKIARPVPVLGPRESLEL
jgi:SanA protein